MPFLLPTAASAVAAAAPAAAAAGASAAATAGIGATLTSIAGNVLMNVAISAAMSIFQPQVGVAGRTFEWTLDPDGPIPFAAGRIGVPGSAVYRKTFGPDLMYYGIPSVISGAGPISAFEGFMADDETVTFDGSGKAVSSQYAGELWYKTSQGAQPDTAITSPTGLKNGATLPGWTLAHKLSGKASYMIVMGENSKGTAFPTGEVKPLITLRGLLVYDPRKDSTYPGGSGEHRLSNPLTWEYSANPILWALKWTLGLWEGPNGKGAPQVDYQVGGIGAKLSGIDVPAFVAAANVADANGWTCAAYPTTDDDKHQVLTGFLQAGGAIYAQRAGKISCIQRAAPRTSIVTVSAYDTAGPLEIDTAASRIDRINTLRPRFWSEPHRWQMTALDQEVTAQTYRDEDGGVRPAGIDYPYVTDAVQAAQLAALQIANTREGIAGVIPLKPHLQRIRPGDAFTITEAGFVLNGLKCLCLNTDYDPATGVVRVSFVSETDAKYPFALGQNPTPPEPQVLTPVDPRYVTPPAPGDWTVTVPGPAPDGSQLPNIDLTGLVSNDTADALLISWRAVASGENPNTPPLYLDPDGNVLPGWMDAGSYAPTIRSLTIQGPKSGAVVWLALRYRRGSNFSAAELKGPITVRTLVADVMPNAPGLSQIKSDIEAAFGDIFDVSTLLSQTRSDLEAADAALGSAIGSLDNRADILETQTQSLEENKASVASLDAQIVRINGVEAVNATQALALVDLENGKVALSEYNTLKGEVLSARDGAPSLLGKIQNLKSVDLDLQENKASVASVDALTARTANTEADIIDLENAAATDRTATAQSIEQVRAAWRGQAINANPSFAQWPNPDAAPTAWITSGSVTREAGKVSPYCARLTGEATLLYTGADLRAVGGGAFFIEVDVRRTSSTGTFADAAILLQAFDDSGNLLVDGSKGFTVSTAPLDPDLNGGGTAIGGGFQGETYRLRLFCDVRYAATRRYFLSAVSLAPNLAFDVDQLALRPATNAEILAGRNLPALSASVTEQSLAIIDLENQQALASWSIKAAATGGKPTILQLLSGSFGSSIAMTAEQIYFGDNTVFDDATDTIQTVWGSTRKVMAWGAPFGPDNLVEWTGPSSIALGSMTKANAGFWVDQVGAYGPTPLPSFWAKVTPTQISRSRTGAGSISTALNDVIVTCYTGTSGATCTWSRVSGDTTINYPSTGFTPVFNTTLAAGQTKTALFVGLVAKGGDVDLVYVNVEFSDNV